MTQHEKRIMKSHWIPSGSILEFGFGSAQDTLVVLHLWPAVTLVIQTVIKQIQVLLHLLGLVYRVRIQNLAHT